MAEGLFSIEIDALDNLIAAYEQMAGRADDVIQPLMEAGREVQRMSIENFESEGGLTDFGFWVMLSGPYEAWKDANHPGHQMLELHDPSPLSDAVHSPEAVRMKTPFEVQYVIEDVKAGWHQYGIDERQQGGHLPARPIIPDVHSVQPRVEEVFIDWVGDIIEESERRAKDLPWSSSHPWWRPRSSLGTFLPFTED